MKRDFTLAILLLIFLSTNAISQNNEELYDKACGCIEEIDLGIDRKLQFEEVESCIETAIGGNQMISKLQAVFEQVKKDSIADLGKKTEKREYNVTINNREGYDDLEEELLRNCAAMKRVMTTSNVASEVSLSDKKNAKKLYDKGMELYRTKDFKGSKKQFAKATKKDPNFAWAWDMLGISSRNLGEYEKAIVAYDKSIALDPKGRMPLMNKPIAYSLNEQNDEAINAYEEFIAIFPEDPEGYYGIGRIYHILEDYGKALDNTMKAYLLYKEIKSPYAQDAERNLALIYNDLKSLERLEIWEIYAKKHNIQIGG